MIVAVKARMQPTADNRQMIAATNSVEEAMKAEFRYIRWSFFEIDSVD